MTVKTEREITLAIARIRHGRQKRIAKDRKFSIAAVAEEAGVSNATLHNRYPALVEHIRQLQREDGQVKTDRQRSEIADLKRQNKDLHTALTERTAELKKIAIINLRLTLELKELRSTGLATVTSISKLKRR
jgi:AcrR family transcriptional regulator